MNWFLVPFLAVSGLMSSMISEPLAKSSNLPNTGRNGDLEKVILVDVVVPSASDAPKCYLTTFDKKRVEVQVEFDDPLNNLTDFVLEGETLEGAECFVPEMKIIYSDYTYLISLYCANVVKYKNSAPFTPSNVKVSNDLEFTEDMLNYLRKAHQRYFGVAYNPAASSKLCQRKLMDEPVNDDPNLVDEENDDDVLKDASSDKEGWFQEVHDEDNSSPVVPDDN